MTLPRRDTLRHTYADYLAWSRSSGDELIDGFAYVKEPPAPSPIQQGIVAELCRQAGNALDDTLSRVFVWKKAATGGPPFLRSKATHKSAPFRSSPLIGAA